MVFRPAADLTVLAEKLLIDLGNPRPTPEHIKSLEGLLSNIIIQTHILIDNRLSGQESLCLLLAAFGKTIAETSKILNIAIDTVKEYRSDLMRKLGCSTMAHAVFQGVRYGYLSEQITLSIPTKVGGKQGAIL